MSESVKAVSQNILIIIELAYAAFIPTGMIVRSMSYGGFLFFLQERLGAVVIIISCLVVVVFSVRGIMHYNFDNGLKLSDQEQLIKRNVLKIKRLFGNKSKLLKKAGVRADIRILNYGCSIGNYSIEAV